MCDRFSDYIVGSRHIAQMSSMHVFICMTGSCIKQLHISAGPAAAAGGAGQLHPHWDLQISSAQVAGETQNQIWMVQDWQLQPHHLWCKPLPLNPSLWHPVLLQGPYKQYMGRSRNTGQLTLVLYEDPPDGVPKIHVRSSKYMAWIAEMMLPTYLHVNKVLNTSTLYLNWNHNIF